MIDNFFNTHLRHRVDTTQRPWRWRDVDGQALGISDGVLAQFERAARIRDGLFAAGAAPRANFEMKPASLDQRVSQVRLDLDGQSVDVRSRAAGADAAQLARPGRAEPGAPVVRADRRRARSP